MAQVWQYQNGLYLPGPTTSTGGLAIARWLFEFATQVCGWTALDVSDDAKWAAVNGSGANGASVVSRPEQFSIVGDPYTFSHAVDAGRNLTITGMTGGNAQYNGIYKILGVLDTKTVTLDIKRSVHENGVPSGQSGLTWRLWENSTAGVTLPDASKWVVMRGTYKDASGNFDVRLDTKAATPPYCGAPAITMSPEASWNIGTHSWNVAPPGVTTAVGGSPGHPGSLYRDGRVWAVGDTNVIVVYWQNITGGNCLPIYIGEITPYYPASDTKPSIVCYGTPSAYDMVIGTGATGTFSQGGGAWLAADRLTSIPVYLSIPSILASDGGSINRLSGNLYRWSAWSKKLYRFEITAQSIAASNSEWRGKLIGCWAGGSSNIRLMPFGDSLEYLHTTGGLVLPWNGSKCHVQV